MTILAINTAQSDCDVAIGRHGAILAARRESLKTGQDARLPGLVDEALGEAGVGLADLSRIGVCIGPGSFTGVRIGVAYARGLALALGIPCIGITSLQACIDPASVKSPLRIALQAKRRPPDRTFWTQRLAPGGAFSAPEEWPVEAFAEPAETILSDAPDILFSPMGIAEVRAQYILRWAAGLEPADAPPSPAYVRPPDAALPGGKAP